MDTTSTTKSSSSTTSTKTTSSNGSTSPPRTLDQLFEDLITHQLSKCSTPDTQTQLKLYGLYKLLNNGPVNSTTTAPSRWDVKGRAKHDAWARASRNYGKLEAREIKAEYIRETLPLMETKADLRDFVSDCNLLLRLDLNQPDCPVEIKESTTDTSKAHDNECTFNIDLDNVNDSHVTTTSSSWMSTLLDLIETLLDTVRIYPRGRLDIDYQDLVFALCYCLWYTFLSNFWTPNKTLQHYQDAIECKFQSRAVVSLSVRTAFDLYLQAKNYPPGSNVVMTCIQINGMLQVAQYHGLNVIPVDYNLDSSGKLSVPSLQDIQAAITNQTVAVMIVHPFGYMGYSSSDFAEFRKTLDNLNIELWEDCAECFAGTTTSIGSPHSHVVFVSFGTIKTCTALGGGVMIIQHDNSNTLIERVNRLHGKYCNVQESTFLFKVCKCIILHTFSTFPLLCGILVRLCNLFCIDYDTLVTSQIKGFPYNETTQFMRALRFKPSVSNLVLLNRRLRNYNARRVTQRIQQCQSLAEQISDSQANVSFPIPQDRNVAWLLPVQIQSKDPSFVSRIFLEAGFDVPRGTSQLGCITSFSQHQQKCPVGSLLMSKILYLPVASYNLPQRAQARLVQALQKATLGTSVPSGAKSSSLISRMLLAILGVLFWNRGTFLIILKILSGILMRLTGWAFLIFIVLVSAVNLFVSYIYLKPSTFIKGLAKTSEETQFKLSDIPGLQFPSNINIHSNDKEPARAVLTGATGFVGSAILRDLLINRETLGISGGVVLFCRRKGQMSAQERINDILKSYSFLSKEEKLSLVCVVESDVSKPELGISSYDFKRLAKFNVTHVIHCAAAVSFVQSLDDAAASNITPALQLQALAIKMWCAKYVHISTTFVHGGLAGTREEPLPERLFSLGEFDAYEIYKSMMDTQGLASYAMQQLGFPNSYTFSKCICEHLLVHKTNSLEANNTIILRPSIVGPAVLFPRPGWAGTKPSTLVAAACFHLKNQWCLWSFGAKQTSVIPVDVASNFIIGKSFSVLPTASQKIFNVTWDRNSPSSASFSWNEFAESAVKVGSIEGHYSRFTAILSHVVNICFIPSLHLSFETFLYWHGVLIKYPIHVAYRVAKLFSPKLENQLKLLIKFIDLPILFLYFSSSNYYFESELLAPSNFDSSQYAVTCCYAAHSFLAQLKESKSIGPSHFDFRENLKRFVIAGKRHIPVFSDWYWALTQPQGNVVIRMVGWILIKTLRKCTTQVTVDVEAFASLANMCNDEEEKTGIRPHIVLAPTHRSYMDFMLLSFICFSLPELGIPIPYICAAEEFQQLPFIGFLVKLAHAFFVKRGKGRPDPSLALQLKRLKTKGPTCFEVFLEGKRSRDRRFLRGRTGFLRCLQETGGTHIIFPIAISYEKLPEQGELPHSLGGKSPAFSLKYLFHWLIKVSKGQVQLGKIHVSGSAPILLPQTNLHNIVETVQCQQKRLMLVSQYHLESGSKALGVSPTTIHRALQYLGCKSWHDAEFDAVLMCSDDITEVWSVVMHWIHFVTPFVESLEWRLWLDRSTQNFASLPLPDNPDVVQLVVAITTKLKSAEEMVHQSLSTLKSQGFHNPTKSHTLQYCHGQDEISCGIALTAFEICMKPQLDDQDEDFFEEKKDVEDCSTCCEGMTLRESIINPLFDSAQEKPEFTPRFELIKEESLGAWGFTDSRFIVNMVGKRKIVTMKGNRYRISGTILPNLIPFIESEMDISLDLFGTSFASPSGQIFMINSCEISQNSIKALRGIFSPLDQKEERVSLATQDRIRHGTGHTQEDMYMLRSGRLLDLRMPDIVVWPNSESEVEELVNLAMAENWCLIPFGGGTNVSHATWCPPKQIEPRPIVSVDMKLMKRFLDINLEDGLVHVQAGITGRELVAEMAKRGLTIGHEPDSIEFSTLGGWVATKASGMKRNKYGNIEDIVRQVRVVGSTGALSKLNDSSAAAFGRTATGMDLVTLMMGSEGCLGIITSVILKVWHIAESQEFECVVLPSFDVGVQFVRDVSKLRAAMPASVRLLDNAQFRLGQSLKPESNGIIDSVKHMSAAAYAGLFCGFEGKQVVGVTIMFEGTNEEVQTQQKQIKKISSKYGGILAGASNGKAGYDLTFAIAYLRDFAMTYYCLGESFETFVPWSKLEEVVYGTKQRIIKEHQVRYLPGKPFISCRVTQLYDEGVCLYFYVCIYFHNVANPSGVFGELEAAAREEILKRGGNLSHHHGIGKLRSRFMSHVNPEPFSNVLQGIKKSFDPENVFGARNGAFSGQLNSTN